MSKRTKIPRASLAVSILDDDDYVEMMSSDNGCWAFSLFVALILEAKVQDNGGVFKTANSVLCKQIKWESRLFKCALDYLLNSDSQWVVRNQPDGIMIRSFEKWNHGWGGSRGGSGRPISDHQKESSGNQDESSVNLDSLSVSVSASVTDSDSVKEIKTVSFSKLEIESIYKAYPKKVAKAAALTAIKKALKELAADGTDDPVAYLLEAVSEYAKSRSVKEGDRQFIKHPSTWFNQACYEDDRSEWEVIGGSSNPTPEPQETTHRPLPPEDWGEKL